MIKKIKYIFIAVSVIFFFGSVIFTPSLVYAAKSTMVTADPFPAERTGQYVYYHDMRKGIYGNKEPVNRLIGLIKADNKQYVLRVCNLNDGKSYLYLGHFILKKGNIEFYTEDSQGDIKEGAFIIADLLNLMDYLGGENKKVSQKLKNKNDITTNSNWTSYNRKLVNSYKWWIPFYKLESSINSESDNYGEKGYTSLKLVCFGSIAPNDPDMFTRISKLPVFHKDKTSSKKYLIPDSEKMAIKLDNVSLNLDKNWQFEKGDPAINTYDSYILKKFTTRDAQIGVESIEIKNFKLDKNLIESFVSSLQYQSCVITESVNIDPKGKTLSLSLWDADSGTATFTKYISLEAKKNLLTMLNFSALDFVYYGNVDYFNAILNTDFNN